MNLEQLFSIWGIKQDKIETAAKWVRIPLTHTITEFGSGNFGNVYDLHNGLVLKITSDLSEAMTSMHLLNKRHPNVVEINKIAKHTVRPIAETQFDIKNYFILQKKYSPNRLAKSIYNMILFSLGIEEGRHYPRATTETYQKIPDDEDTIKKVVNPVLQELGLDIPSSLETYTKAMLNIRAGLEFLKQNGIKFNDAHYNNILVDKATGDYVIVDLGGNSSSPQQEEPEEIVETSRFQLLEAYIKQCATIAEQWQQDTNIIQTIVDKFPSDYDFLLPIPVKRAREMAIISGKQNVLWQRYETDEAFRKQLSKSYAYKTTAPHRLDFWFIFDELREYMKPELQSAEIIFVGQDKASALKIRDVRSALEIAENVEEFVEMVKASI